MPSNNMEETRIEELEKDLIADDSQAKKQQKTVKEKIPNLYIVSQRISEEQEHEKEDRINKIIRIKYTIQRTKKTNTKGDNIQMTEKVMERETGMETVNK